MHSTLILSLVTQLCMSTAEFLTKLPKTVTCNHGLSPLCLYELMLLHFPFQNKGKAFMFTFFKLILFLQIAQYIGSFGTLYQHYQKEFSHMLKFSYSNHSFIALNMTVLYTFREVLSTVFQRLGKKGELKDSENKEN